MHRASPFRCDNRGKRRPTSGAGQFRAMDVAKPLLSVSKLVEHGLQHGSKKVPVTMTGGVFKIAMDFHRQPIEGLTA